MNAETLLLRQAHPHFMAGDRPTSQVFLPFPKDQGLLSVYDGDQINAAEAHGHYTHVLGNESHSVWAVTQAEAAGENVPASPDPRPDFPAHATMDFREKSDNECRKIAKKLKARAIARGCQYLPA